MATLLIPQRPTYHPLLPFIPTTIPYKLPLSRCCAVCGPKHQAPPPLLTCSRCKAATYCSRDHQEQDFASHKQLCKYVGKCRKKMDARAEALPAAIFTERAGHFWHVQETRPYMEAKLFYLLALTASRTHDGVSLAAARA